MANLPSGNMMPVGSWATFNKIRLEQGMLAFWRGNMPQVWKTIMQNFIRLGLYDKIKNFYMPYESRKYVGLDYFVRASCAAVTCMTI